MSRGQGGWVVPDAPVFAAGVGRASTPAEQAGGHAVRRRHRDLTARDVLGAPEADL